MGVTGFDKAKEGHSSTRNHASEEPQQSIAVVRS